MAHSCPDCGLLCHCGSDIDDYLEQECCTDTIDGRRWTTDTLCFECDDDVAPSISAPTSCARWLRR
jgi:hypothetical protein